MVKIISTIRLGMVIGVSSLVLIGAVGCNHDDGTAPATAGKTGAPAPPPPPADGGKGAAQAGTPNLTKPQTLPPPGK
jgi:hypothetical protein